MVQPSGCFEAGLERRSGMDDGPEHIRAPAGECDDGLVVTFPFTSLALVEGAAVVVCERAEGGLVEHALEAPAAAVWPAQEARPAGLPQHWRHAGGRGECVGGAEARQVACLGDELCGEHDSHAGQAADESLVRVASEQRLQFAVEFDQPGAAGQRLDGKLADQACGHALGWNDDGLLGCGGERIHVGQAAGCLQVAHQALLASSAQLGMRHVTGKQVKRPLGFKVEAGFQARKDADKQVAHARQALGLRLHQIAAAADQQLDLEIDLGGRLDAAQVRPGSHLVSNGAGVARVGLILASNRALTGAVDGHAGHVNQVEPGLGQHGFGEACNAADDVKADASRAAEGGQLPSQRRDLSWRVQQLAVDLHDAIGIDGSGPVYLLGDIDPYADPHDASWQLKVRHAAHAAFALHSDESPSLISGRGGAAVPGNYLRSHRGQPA